MALASKVRLKVQAAALKATLTIFWHYPQIQGPTNTTKVNTSYNNKLIYI